MVTTTYNIKGIEWTLQGKSPHRRLKATKGAFKNGHWTWVIVESNNGTGRWNVHNPSGKAVLQGRTANEAAHKVARLLAT